MNITELGIPLNYSYNLELIHGAKMDLVEELGIIRTADLKTIDYRGVCLEVKIELLGRGVYWIFENSSFDTEFKDHLYSGLKGLIGKSCRVTRDGNLVKEVKII